MPRFHFALSTADLVESGFVQSDSLDEAMAVINEHVSAREGDTLEIGVRGFPPARYECVWSIPGTDAAWRPAGELAA